MKNLLNLMILLPGLEIIIWIIKMKLFQKLLFFKKKDSCRYELFWWCNLTEWEYKDVPDGVDIRWRSHFM